MTSSMLEPYQTGDISGSRMESAVQGKLACCVRREAKGTPCQSGIAWPTLQEKALRHEVTRVIVWHGVLTRPAVPSAVSYADVRQGNDPYSACGHGTHSHATGT